MDLYGELRDFGYLLAWGMLIAGFLFWVIWEIRDTAFQNGYWKGRAHGWEMHRRMTNIKKESDEVFDYDKQS
jgi:hypothetical protein